MTVGSRIHRFPSFRDGDLARLWSDLLTPHPPTISSLTHWSLRFLDESRTEVVVDPDRIELGMNNGTVLIQGVHQQIEVELMEVLGPPVLPILVSKNSVCLD